MVNNSSNKLSDYGSNSANISQNSSETTEGMDIIILDPIIYAIFSILTAIGSFLIFWLFTRNKKLRTITGYLMIFITIIDTCTALFVLVPSVFTTIAGFVPWEDTVICSLQAYSNMFLQNFKACLIMLCALDRAYSLLRPFAYQRQVTKKVLFACLVLITFFAMIMPVYLWGYRGWKGSPSGSPMCWPTLQDETSKVIYWISIAVDLICPGIIVVICYGLIVVIVIKQRKAIQEQKHMMSLSNNCSRESEKRTPKHPPVTHQQSEALPVPGSQNANNKLSTTLSAIRGHTITNAGLDWIQHLAACKMLFLVTVLYFLTHVPIYIADHFFLSNIVLMTFCNYLAYLSTWMNFVIYFNTDSFFKNAAKSLFKSAAPQNIKLDTRNNYMTTTSTAL